jgi:hypothetical protein
MSENPKRDEILARVRRGEMSTGAADQWAAENGQTFSIDPDPTRFDPIEESFWTLPMATAWIIERSYADVRVASDRYRREQVRWEFVWGVSEGGSSLPGFELKRLEAIPLFQFLAGDPLEDPSYSSLTELLRELKFALRSGQLSATGVKFGGRDRVRISKRSWLGPYPFAERANHYDALYALDDECEIYSDVLVPRDEVLGIWATKHPDVASASEGKGLRARPLPTLPARFDRADWSVEHVLAWLSNPNLAELRALEVADPERPPWYGRTCRRGYIDPDSEDAFRDALIKEEVIGFKGENPIRGEWWRVRPLRSQRSIWFRSDRVMERWKEGANAIAPSCAANAPAGIDPGAIGDASAEDQSRLSDSRTSAKGPGSSKSAARKTGPKTGRRVAVVAAMKKNIAENKLTLADLQELSNDQLITRYGALARITTIRQARELVGSDLGIAKIADNSRQKAPNDK